MVLKNRVAMFLAEFLGAATLTAAVYTIAARTSFPLFTGIAAAATVALFTVAVGSASGAHLNPAITFGMWSVRKVSTVRAVVMIVAQMLGGLAASVASQVFLGTRTNKRW